MPLASAPTSLTLVMSRPCAFLPTTCAPVLHGAKKQLFTTAPTYSRSGCCAARYAFMSVWPSTWSRNAASEMKIESSSRSGKSSRPRYAASNGSTVEEASSRNAAYTSSRLARALAAALKRACSRPMKSVSSAVMPTMVGRVPSAASS